MYIMIYTYTHHMATNKNTHRRRKRLVSVQASHPSFQRWSKRPRSTPDAASLHGVTLVFGKYWKMVPDRFKA